MKKKKKYLPLVSVIIPTLNRKEILKKSLLGFFSQDYPKNKFETIVINSRLINQFSVLLADDLCS